MGEERGAGTVELVLLAVVEIDEVERLRAAMRIAGAPVERIASRSSFEGSPWRRTIRWSDFSQWGQTSSCSRSEAPGPTHRRFPPVLPPWMEPSWEGPAWEDEATRISPGRSRGEARLFGFHEPRGNAQTRAQRAGHWPPSTEGPAHTDTCLSCGGNLWVDRKNARIFSEFLLLQATTAPGSKIPRGILLIAEELHVPRGLHLFIRHALAIRHSGSTIRIDRSRRRTRPRQIGLEPTSHVGLFPGRVHVPRGTFRWASPSFWQPRFEVRFRTPDVPRGTRLASRHSG